MSRQEWREWVQAASLLAIPIAVALVGAYVAKSNGTRETNAKMVEIAARLISEPPSDSMRVFRIWATKVIQRYSDVPFPAESAVVRSVTLMAEPRDQPFLTIAPTDVIVVPGQDVQFTVIVLTSTGDTTSAPDLQWRSYGGGTIARAGGSRGRYAARFTADTVAGDFSIEAGSSHLGVQVGATVHVLPRRLLVPGVTRFSPR